MKSPPAELQSPPIESFLATVLSSSLCHFDTIL